MFADRLADLKSFQTVIAFPFVMDLIEPAVLFNLFPALCLKNCLPRKINSPAVISYVAQLPAGKYLQNLGRDVPGDQNTAGQWRLSSRCGRLNAIEDNPHRPIAGIGIFIVLRNGLVFGVLGGGIYILS